MNLSPTSKGSTTYQCSVCGSTQNKLFIETKTMMHDGEKSNFFFNRCDYCESVFLTNPVKEDDLGAYYTASYLPYRGEKAWGKYDSWVVRDDNNLNQNRVKLVQKYSSNTSTELDILDIGCGKPDFLAKLKNSLSVNAVGVDFTPANWENTKYRGIRLIEGDWRKMEINNQFDVITAWHYLEHDYQLAQTVKTIHDLLKPGGYFIAEVPMYQGILQRIQKQFWQGWHTPRHITLFSFKSWNILFPEDKWKLTEHRKNGTLSSFTLWWLGYHEKKKRKWSESMEPYFWGLVFWKIVLSPVFILERLLPMGVQIIVIQKK